MGNNLILYHINSYKGPFKKYVTQILRLLNHQGLSIVDRKSLEPLTTLHNIVTLRSMTPLALPNAGAFTLQVKQKTNKIYISKVARDMKSKVINHVT